MRIEIACFSEHGRVLAERLRQVAGEQGDTAAATRCGAGGEALAAWTARCFPAADALVFVGAAGIAVRAVAPHIVSKTSDPAVVAMDEAGRFAIALLSGHIGGANAFAVRLAGMVGATPVVTTATDGRGLFAVDTWATQRGYALRNPEGIKRVSARLLAGDPVRASCAFPVTLPLPPGLAMDDEDFDFSVDVREPTRPGILQVVPPALVLGVGCRRGTAAAALEEAFVRLCADTGLCPEAFGRVCSIELKKDEAGIIDFAAGRGMAFETFSAGMLGGAEGEFSASEFVGRITGVDNVCERAAAVGSGAGRLLVGKSVFPGIALAVACRDVAIDMGMD